MKLKSFLIIFLTVIFGTARANIIRDSEIEETLQLISAPLTQAAHLKNLKIYLIKSDELNAFTAGGAEIYLFSEMITRFPNIDVIRGVIAHEMGHILGKHVVRQAEIHETYNKVALSSIAVGLAAAISGKLPATSGLAVALGGMHYSDRSILAYSRGFESSADQTAFKLLEASGNSAKGMIEYFEYMERKYRGIFINPYNQTHPLNSERITALKNLYQKSKFKESQNSPEVQYKFARSAVKLIAFVTDLKQLNNMSAPSKDPEITHYFNAIKYFRKSELNKALENINILLETRPADAFYHELKGQILFEFGKKGALDSYAKAANLRPNDMLIKLGKGVVGISNYLDQPAKMEEYYKDLKVVANREPDNILALYYIAIYYEKTGQRAKSLLNTAIIAMKTGDLHRAKGLARAAIKEFRPETPEWYKANDIILTEK